MTFQEIYDIIKPINTIDFWDNRKRARVLRVMKRKDINSLLRAMDLFPEDWTNTERAEFAEKLWGK